MNSFNLQCSIKYILGDNSHQSVVSTIPDIFSKYITAVPLKTKQPDYVLQGLKDGFHNMGGKPESIYSDDEGAFNSKLLQDYFKESKIDHIVTRGHAAFAERAIRTIKNLIY